MNTKGIFYITGILCLLLFFSCTEEEQPVVYGDVIVQSFKSDSVTVYGTCFYAYSYDKIKSAMVSKEGSESIIQLDSASYRYAFSFTPDSAGFSTEKPSSGQYVFTITLDDGSVYEADDYLEAQIMEPPVLKVNEFDTSDIRLNLQWETVEYADQYRILLENEEGKTVFQSNFLSSAQTSFSITTSTDGWLTGKIPSGGEKYRPVVVAYQYETIATAYDLQSISLIRENYFKWLTDNE